MPPLGGLGWVPEGWRPRLLLGLLVVALLGTSAAALYHAFGPPAQALQNYRTAWATLTEAQRAQVNKWLQKAPPGDS